MRNILKERLIDLEDYRIKAEKNSENISKLQCYVSEKEYWQIDKEFSKLKIEGLKMKSENDPYSVDSRITFIFDNNIYKVPELTEQEQFEKNKALKKNDNNIVLFKNNIKALLDERGMTITALSEAIELTYRATHNLVNNSDLANVKLQTLDAVATALNVNIAELYCK